MRITTPAEIESVLRLDGPERFRHFVKRVADSERAWGLWNDGWALMENDDGTKVFPLWPAQEYADLHRTGDWAGYQAREIEVDSLLDELLPRLAESGTLAGVFPIPRGKGVTPSLAELSKAIRDELGRYEVETAMFPPPVPGCRIGNLLGEGTTGTVYEAVNANGEALAIKFLRETFADDPEMVARFKREASICQRLRSEHIAAVVGAGRTEQTYWIAYRRLVGETLDGRLRRDRVMSAESVAPIVEQVLQGLAVAHAAGVVHRDIKPANIVLERTPAGERACILDFGISKDRSRSGSSTSGGSLTSHTATLGTINYMPPEQIGASASVDHRADLYSAGVVAYRALAGQLPYVGSSQAAVLYAKINQDARSLSEATGMPWPEALVSFFRRALAREPSARFGGAEEMATAWLEACRAGTTPDLERLRKRNVDSQDSDDTVLEG